MQRRIIGLLLLLSLFPKTALALVGGIPIQDLLATENAVVSGFLARVATVHLSPRTGGGRSVPCTGLYWRDGVVITAAHCFDHLPFIEKVVIGTKPFRAKKYLIRSDYISWFDGLQNDIALIFLDNETPTETPEFQFGDVPHEGYLPKLSMIGAGQSDFDNESDFVILRKDYAFDFIPRVALEAFTIIEDSATKPRIKAQGNDKKTMGGDSGGPVFFVNAAGAVVFVGAISSGSPNATTNQTTTIQAIRERDLEADRFIDPIERAEKMFHLKLIR